MRKKVALVFVLLGAADVAFAEVAAIAVTPSAVDAHLVSLAVAPPSATSESPRAHMVAPYITPSLHHLTLNTAGCASSSSTISWNSGGEGGQVRISVNGGQESALWNGVSGSQSYSDFPNAGYYVFLLYASGSPSATLLAWTSINVKMGPCTWVGFNYWREKPGEASCTQPTCPNCSYSTKILEHANWWSDPQHTQPSPLQQALAADLDHMASLSAGLVRFVVWSHPSGYEYYPVANPPAGAYFTSAYGEQVQNMPSLLRLCAARGLKAVIVFVNQFLDHGGTPWWYEVYGLSGQAAFIADSVTWVSGFVTAVEADSQARGAVLYYDYQHEYNTELWGAVRGPYVRGLYDQVPVPRGKRGMSVLFANPGMSELASQFASGNPVPARRLDYIDFHLNSSMNSTCGFNSGLNQPLITPAGTGSLPTTMSYFPDSTIVIGEFGRNTGNPSYSCYMCPPTAAWEQAQEDYIFNTMSDIVNNNIAYSAIWAFRDYAPQWDNLWGIGHTVDDPKDAMGTFAATRGMVVNPDMETVVSGKPDSWSASDGATLSSVSGSAASNTYHAHIAYAPSSGNAYLQSSDIAVNSSKTFFVNAYVRSNMSSIGIDVVEIDSNGLKITKQGLTMPSVSSSTFSSYLGAVGSWSFALNSQTVQVRVRVRGTATAANQFLDVDTVSGWQHR